MPNNCPQLTNDSTPLRHDTATRGSNRGTLIGIHACPFTAKHHRLHWHIAQSTETGLQTRRLQTQSNICRTAEAHAADGAGQQSPRRRARTSRVSTGPTAGARAASDAPRPTKPIISPSCA